MSLSRAFPKQPGFVFYSPPLKPNSMTGQEGRANTASTPPSVEIIDLTDLADGNNHRMSDGDGASTIVDSDIDFSPSNELQTTGSEEFTARRSTPQGNMCGESSSQPAPSEGSGQENAIVIKDCQRESDTNSGDKDCPLENEDPGTSTSDRCGGEHSPAMENAIHSKPDEGHTSRVSGRPLLGSTAVKFNAAMQEGGGSSLLKADTHRLRRPIYKVDRQDSRITSSNNGSDGDVNNNNGTHTRNQKRKELSYFRPYSNPPSYNDHGGDRSIPVPGSKRRKSGSRRRMDKHVEYEVEQIVNVCINDKGDLQYRVLWVGYQEDPTWYDASNFKNSPHKLNDFHKANPTRPGPPKRLGIWLKCWEDTADHSDDNKAQ